MLIFQQSESTAERRRWILVLVDSADGVTGLTGQTGTVFISKNGGAGTASTNSIVEVDAGDMPGHYYIELTAAELDTLGHISISKKTAGSLAFHDRAIVSYNDPFISAGGFASGGGGDSFKLTKKHIEAIAEQVWAHKVGEDGTTLSKLLEAANHPIVDTVSLSEQIKSIVIPEFDLSSVMEKIDSINIPQPFNYSKELSTAISGIDKLNKILPVDLSGVLKNIVDIKNNADDIKSSIISSQGEVNVLTDNVKTFQDSMKELDHLIERFGDTLDQRTDIEKRFNELSEKERNEEIDEIKESINNIKDGIPKLAEKMINMKFEILGQINK